MIDLLELKIPFDSSIVETVDDSYAFVGIDLSELDIPLGAKSIHWREDGTIGTSNLYHPYESLPTSFTGMAFKCHFDGHFFPHVTLKTSPAKILQGHNVFGFDDMALSVEEMLYQLSITYPVLYGLLALQETSILKMDITYIANVDSPMQVRQLVDYMSRVSNGHTKPTKSKKYETTCYWGGHKTRLIKQKLYSKWEEYNGGLMSEYSPFWVIFVQLLISYSCSIAYVIPSIIFSAFNFFLYSNLSILFSMLFNLPCSPFRNSSTLMSKTSHILMIVSILGLFAVPFAMS